MFYKTEDYLMKHCTICQIVVIKMNLQGILSPRKSKHKTELDKSLSKAHEYHYKPITKSLQTTHYKLIVTVVKNNVHFT